MMPDGSDAPIDRDAPDEDAIGVGAAMMLPGSRVVRARELDRWLDGEAAMRRAEAAAAAIVAEAGSFRAAECERGYREGWAEAEHEVARALAEAAGMLRTSLAEMEQALPDIVCGIVADMVGAFDTRAVLEPALRRGLERVRRGTDAVLRVAPDASGAAAAALAALGLAGSVRLEADPRMESGRCVFESRLGKAELGLAAQLDVLRETLGERWEVSP